jgi:hypothetical protein
MDLSSARTDLTLVGGHLSTVDAGLSVVAAGLLIA